jgi:hypothetical protein
MELELVDVARRIQSRMDDIGAHFERQVREQFADPAVDRGHYADAQKVTSMISVQAERDPSRDALDFDMGAQITGTRLRFFSAATDLENDSWADFGWAEFDATAAIREPSTIDPLIERATVAMREYMDNWLRAQRNTDRAGQRTAGPGKRGGRARVG